MTDVLPARKQSSGENLSFPSIHIILRTGNDDLEILTPNLAYSAKLSAIISAFNDESIRKALEVLKRSKLPNPAVVLIEESANGIDSPRFNAEMSAALRNAVRNLPGNTSGKADTIIPPRVPGYLIGDGKNATMHELFLSFENDRCGDLADLVAWGEKNASREYFTADGRPKYFFISVKNSAPVEFKSSDLEKISATQVSSVNGIYSEIVIMKNGVKVAFGGLSGVNSDFL